jgi:hypothetical protein
LAQKHAKHDENGRRKGQQAEQRESAFRQCMALLNKDL